MLYRELPVGLAGISVALLLAAAAAPAATAQESPRLIMDAEQAYEEGMGAWGVRYDAERGGLILTDRRLIEDDGPGIKPYNTKQWYHLSLPEVVSLEGDVHVKKTLHVEHPEASEATLVLHSRSSNAIVVVNGEQLSDQSGRYRSVPPELLRAGDNEVELRPGRRGSLAVLALRDDIVRNAPERADDPPRSFKSTDGGRNWESVDGEYMVRLHLVQHQVEGRIISPVIELSGQTPGLLDPVAVDGVRLRVETQASDGTQVTLEVRTGPTPVYDEQQWSEWQPADRVTVAAGSRYLQWQATLSTRDARQTPVLEQVTVLPRVNRNAPSWARGLTLVEHHNPAMRYTSIPFAYEDFNHPKLVALREKHKLDEVVAGADSELERFVLLRHWVGRQLRYSPPVQSYPAWDADEIITRGDGFCVQFAIALMQVYQSMGHPARYVFGYHPGGNPAHEVVEVWSSEHDKWVLMDLPSNIHHVDPETHTPLSMLEIHERMIQGYYGEKMITPANRPPDPTGGDYLITVRGTNIEPDPKLHRQLDLEPTKSPRWNRWAVMRMMPRSDFYSRTYPLPIHQGFGPDWSDYVAWQTPQTPAYYNYRYHGVTNRRSDWEWTLNRVRFDATAGSTPGMVEVQMGTETPGFETFRVRTGDGEWRSGAARFTWELEPGRNRLEMRARNDAGIAGAVSYIELDYEP
ncbi:MAG: transglutaminase-like domain-containing protein [Phycisphaeraceae bacterium]